MSKTINLNIPTDAATRARLSVIRTILNDLLAHNVTFDQTVQALDHLVLAELKTSDEVHATGRTRAGNDISGI